MIVVPVTHDLTHLATVHTARLPLSLLDEVAEERGAWRKRHMVHVAVQGLVHSEHESSHTTSFLTGTHRGSDYVMQSVVSEIDVFIMQRTVESRYQNR